MFFVDAPPGLPGGVIIAGCAMAKGGRRMDDLFHWLDSLTPKLDSAPFRQIYCPRCGAWVALISYADPDDPMGRAQAIAGLARESGIPTYLITLASPDDFTIVVHTLHPPVSEPILTAEQFKNVLMQLAEQHDCTA
jgi:hypothetical protein